MLLRSVERFEHIRSAYPFIFCSSLWLEPLGIHINELFLQPATSGSGQRQSLKLYDQASRAISTG